MNPLARAVKGLPLSECRDCHEPIRFVRLDTGNALAVNPHPVPPDSGRGNVCARVLGRGGLHGYVTSKDKPADPHMLRFVPHAAKCEENPANQPRPPEAALF